MGLLQIIRGGVKVADKITKPLQSEVTYKRMTGPTDTYGTKGYGPAVKIQASVDWRSKQVRTQAGELTVTRATLTLTDVATIKRVTNNQGIGEDDIFILPDGTTGPILDLGGFIDAGTGQPFATEVMLG